MVDVKYVRDRCEAAELDKVFKRWRRSVGQNPSPSQRDAVEFATLLSAAGGKLTSKSALRRVRSVLKRMQDMIRDEPSQEIRVLAAARALWRKRDAVVGICLFR
ncbi:MAG: hypothetical protein DMG57_17830 [Acidobacteria bacterium]|nr:MAG: hypothetical protein DMG57_17830 [Acidobacteriota bacterium]